jgi:glucans biosynthesis protein C
MGIKEKELSIETLRGFAIVFMVAGHVIGNDPAYGMRLPMEHSGWRYFYFCFEYLRMPLFTVISGYVYSLRPIGNSPIFSFYKGKARRILLPMIFVGTIFFFTQYFMPGTNTKPLLSDLWKIYVIEYQHFYFLQAIFLIFIFIGIIDHFKLMVTFRNFLILFLVTALLRNFIPRFMPNVFSVCDFISLLPFFILGCGINRFSDLFREKSIIRPATIVFILAILVQQFVWFSRYNMNYIEINTLSLFVACPGIIVLFYVRKNIPFMSKIGYYAYGIFLFHVFGTAGSRIFLWHFGVYNNILVFSSGLFFGIFIPVIIELILEKWKITRMLFLGLK